MNLAAALVRGPVHSCMGTVMQQISWTVEDYQVYHAQLQSDVEGRIAEYEAIMKDPARRNAMRTKEMKGMGESVVECLKKKLYQYRELRNKLKLDANVLGGHDFVFHIICIEAWLARIDALTLHCADQLDCSVPEYAQCWADYACALSMTNEVPDVIPSLALQEVDDPDANHVHAMYSSSHDEDDEYHRDHDPDYVSDDDFSVIDASSCCGD